MTLRLLAWMTKIHCRLRRGIHPRLFRPYPRSLHLRWHYRTKLQPPIAPQSQEIALLLALFAIRCLSASPLFDGVQILATGVHIVATLNLRVPARIQSGSTPPDTRPHRSLAKLAALPQYFVPGAFHDAVHCSCVRF